MDRDNSSCLRGCSSDPSRLSPRTPQSCRGVELATRSLGPAGVSLGSIA